MYYLAMTNSLRDRQKALARTAILEAVADEIVELGAGAWSMQAVAERAGVSTRTLYNYFENREALVQALLDAVDGAGRGRTPLTVPDDFDLVPDAIRVVHAAWHDQGNLARAGFQLEAARIAAGGDGVRREGDRNGEAIRQRVQELHPDLDPEVAEATAQIMRTTLSGRTWFRLTAEQGLPSPVAAEASAWAWRVLSDAVAAGDLPVPPGAAPAPAAD